MPKRVPAGEKRVALNVLVLPETREWLKGAKVHGSQGELVDRAVANLRLTLGEPGEYEYGLPALPTREVQERLDDERKVIIEKVEQEQVAPRRLPVESWRRGPRQKGDKSR